MKSEELIALLPWYLNGTLSDDERAAVEDWLATSPDGQAELVALKLVRQNLQNQPLPPASDLGWARLKRDINHQPARRQLWKPALATAAGLVVCLQVAILARPVPENPMTLLSATPYAIAEPGWLVQLEIHPATTWAELSDALAQLNARLVDGSGSAGIVRVYVSKKDPRFGQRDEIEILFSQLPGVSHAAVEAEY